MKTFKLLLIFTGLILINRVRAQNIPSQKIGIVTYVKQSKITDTNSFNRTSVLFVNNLLDSIKTQIIAEKRNVNEAVDTSIVNNTIKSLKNLLLQEIFKTDFQEKNTDEFQKDKIVNFVIGDQSNKIERFNFNYADHLVYNSFNSEEIEDYFESEEIISLKEYKTENKLIKGYNCFKVAYVYREKFDNTEFQTTEMIIERELWVTDKIIAPFHSIIRNQQILSKYYPLEITEKMRKVNGFETKYLVENVSLK